MKNTFTLQTVLFPRPGIYQPDEIYFHSTGLRETAPDRVRLHTGQYFVTDSYFNSFDIDFWRKNTGLKTFGCSFDYQGILLVRVWTSTDRFNHKQHLLCEYNLKSDKRQTHTLFENLPLEELRGYLTIDITSFRDDSVFYGGRFFTNDAPLRNARIGMVVCSFKREKYVVRNMEQWKRDLFENTEWRNRFDLFLVDNGNTLPDFKCDRIHQCVNPNSGGAGGFTRGMMEAVKSDCTHMLLMDDDLTLHSGVLQRGWAMSCFLLDKRCISAAMLNYDDEMCIQHERGGILMGDAPGCGMNRPMGFRADARRFDSVFHENLQCFTYGAWWWFLCPMDAWRKDDIGYAFPFFVKGDDIDFSLRLAEKGYKVTYPAGMAVWHEPFFNKLAPFHEYLAQRNQLILAALHDIRYAPPRVLLHRMMELILTYHYETAALTLAGIKDFLRGPAVIESHTPTWLLHYAKMAHDEKPKSLDGKVMTDCRNDLRDEKMLHRVFRLLTFNGLLLPAKHEEVNIFLSWANGAWQRDTYRCRQVTYVRLAANEYYTVKQNRKAILALTADTLLTVARLQLGRGKAAKMWKTAAAKLTTPDAWRRYWAAAETEPQKVKKD